MTDEPTLHSLDKSLVRYEAKLDTILGKLENIGDWQEGHANDDKENFEKLHTRISSLRTYGGSIAIVAGAIGAVIGLFI